jgi:hypothetical protein
MTPAAAQRTFQRAIAAELLLYHEVFDLSVTNLVFHEVRSARDKKDVISEALRVVGKSERSLKRPFIVRRICILHSRKNYIKSAWGDLLWNR